MDKLKTRVTALLQANQLPIQEMQQINEIILKAYKLSINGVVEVFPKEVEIFYVNPKGRFKYIDSNMHCQLDPHTYDEFWALQSNRFGKLYMHRKGLGGMDICLSDSKEYALCCTIKAAVVNGEEYWSQLNVRNAVLDALCRHEGIEPTKENRIVWMNRLNEPEAISLLSPREETIEGMVYHLHRHRLRRRDKYVRLPLCSIMDIWNKKFLMSNVQKVNLYMSYHPDADVLEVLRQNNFRYIPTEIKMRYHIDKKAKLYE